MRRQILTQDLLEGVAHDVAIERVLVLEVCIECGAVDARTCGDFTDGQRVQTLFHEQFIERPLDQLACTRHTRILADGDILDHFPTISSICCVGDKLLILPIETGEKLIYPILRNRLRIVNTCCFAANEPPVRQQM
jgi:hypothetical protein